MNKVIILSVQPQWLHKILTGEKTIEIRKSKPKCDYPIDVYLYCTNAKPFLMVGRNDNKTYLDNGGKNSAFSPNHNYIGNRRIVAKFTLNKVDYTTTVVKYGKNYTHEKFEKDIKNYVHLEQILEQTCLTEEELINYELTNHTFGVFAWHIDDLQIFDKPMELSEFYKNNFDEDEAKPCNCGKYCEFQDYDYVENQPCCGIDYDGSTCPFLKVQRPPMSWAYAYKEE